MNKAIKTKNQISQALIELLNNKPLDLITIKELAKITLCRFFVFFITKNGLEKHGKSHATPLLNKSRKK